MRYWILEYDSPGNDEESHESFPDDETAYDDRVTQSLERETRSPRKIFPASEEVFALTAELCSINFNCNLINFFNYFSCYGSTC